MSKFRRDFFCVQFLIIFILLLFVLHNFSPTPPLDEVSRATTDLTIKSNHSDRHINSNRPKETSGKSKMASRLVRTSFLQVENFLFGLNIFTWIS